MKHSLASLNMVATQNFLRVAVLDAIQQIQCFIPLLTKTQVAGGLP